MRFFNNSVTYLSVLLILLLLIPSCSQDTISCPPDTTKASASLVSTTPSPVTTPSSPSHTLFPPVNVTPGVTQATVATTTIPEPETPKPVDEREENLAAFVSMYQTNTGKELTMTRALTADELALVAEFVDDSDVQMVLSALVVSIYKPEDIDPVQIINANPDQFPDNPYGNDSSMMKKSELERVVRKCLGIEIDDQIQEQIVAGRVEYLPAFDAYCVRYGSFGAFEAQDEMMGYIVEDGKWLVHLRDNAQVLDGPMVVLLIPTDNGFLIEAGKYV